MKLLDELMVLRVSLSDISALSDIADLGVEDLIENRHIKDILNFCFLYYRKNRSTPPVEVILSKFSSPEYQRVINQATEIEADPEYVINLLISEKKRRGFIRLMAEVKGKLDDPDTDIEELWMRGREFLTINRVKDLGIDYAEDFPRSYIQAKVYSEPVQTGITDLDHALDGGPRKGWLLFVAAGSSMGKSALLQNFTISALLQRKFVVYVTLEMDAQEVEERLDKILYISLMRPNSAPSDIVRSLEIIDHQDIIEKVVKKAFHGSFLRIVYYPPNQLSVYRLQNILDDIEFKYGREIDMVVVDYGDLMKPPKSRSEQWQEVEDIFKSLKGLAKTRNVLVWTATQVGKKNTHREIIYQSEVYGGSGKNFHADFALTISRTKEDLDRGTGRLFLAKARHGPMGITIPFMVTAGLLWLPPEFIRNTIFSSFPDIESEIRKRFPSSFSPQFAPPPSSPSLGGGGSSIGNSSGNTIYVPPTKRRFL